MTFLVPNFRSKKVSEVENETPSGIGVKVKSADTEWHDPTPAEEDAEVVANGPNSQPGTTKEEGEWVGVEIGGPA